MKKMQTAAIRADVLVEGTKLATRAASTTRHAMQPQTPVASHLFRGKRSTTKDPVTGRRLVSLGDVTAASSDDHDPLLTGVECARSEPYGRK